MAEIETLAKWLAEGRRIVFFGGAGVSTESGIPDFRSEGGVYSKKREFPPEYMLSHEFFVRRTADFFDFYRSAMIYRSAMPNAAHRVLARLENEGRLTAVVTQNIDGLHQKAGSKNVLELHGSAERNHCLDCGRSYQLDFIAESTGVPRCDCGGVVKPDVVLYGEQLPEAAFLAAERAVAGSDVLVVGGTSLSVYPAAGLVGHYRGERLALINKSPTKYDRAAGLVIHAAIGETLEKAAALF